MDKQTEKRYYAKKTITFDGAPLMVGSLDYNDPLIKKALVVANTAHLGKLDKGGHSFIYHPISLAERFHDPEEVATALLHDVVEDTPLTCEDLLKEGFSSKIVTALDLLCHKKGDTYFAYFSKLQKNPLAYKVKLVDLEMNLDLNRLNWVRSKDAEREIRYEAALNGYEEKSYRLAISAAEDRLTLVKEGEIISKSKISPDSSMDDWSKLLASVFALLDKAFASNNAKSLPCSILVSFYLGEKKRPLEEPSCFDAKVSNNILHFLSQNPDLFQKGFASGLVYSLIVSLKKSLLIA